MPFFQNQTCSIQLTDSPLSWSTSGGLQSTQDTKTAAGPFPKVEPGGTAGGERTGESRGTKEGKGSEWMTPDFGHH